MLAVGLALVVMVSWNYFFSPPPPDKPAGTIESPTGTAPVAAVMAPARSQAGLGLDGKQIDASSESERPEQRIALTFPNFTAEFSDREAALVSWKLTDPKYKRDLSLHGEMVAPTPGRGLFHVNFARSSHVIPRGALWTGEKLSDTQLRYTYRDSNLEVVKTFTIHPADYLVQLTVQAAKLGAGEAQQRLTVTSYGYQDPKVEVADNDQTRAFMSSTLLANGEIAHTTHKSLVSSPRVATGFRWTGFDHPYLLIAMAPHPRVTGVEKFTAVTPDPGGIQTDVLFPMAAMRAGAQPSVFEMITFIGPKHYEELERADQVAGFTTGFKDTVDLGWFKIIGRPMLWLLQFFYGVAGNWGIAIILLTVLVKLATLYWTTKSMRSMKAMAALAPKMKELTEKYGKGSPKVQQETMALYKHHGINPLAGCLPIFLQMPIWIALYRMLSSASELYLQPFIPGWIGDLTARDPFYILPIIVMVTMFVQTKLQPAAVDSTQQKMMLYGMPLMFGVMGLFFPAGLTLYMFTNTVLSALHSVYMNKFDKKSLAAAEKIKASMEPGAAAAAAKAANAANAANAAAEDAKDAKVAKAAKDEESSSQSKETVASRGKSGNSKNKRTRR